MGDDVLSAWVDVEIDLERSREDSMQEPPSWHRRRSVVS